MGAELVGSGGPGQWAAPVRRRFSIRIGYPKRPMPNAAVHRMENATRMIIQMSSFFMIATSF